MFIKYWVEKHLTSDSFFKREANASYLNEVSKFDNNEKYYLGAQDPSIFMGLVCYHDYLLTTNILCKLVLSLPMRDIHDDIKMAILSLKVDDMPTNKVKEQSAIIENLRHSLNKKNNILARIASFLYKLKFSNVRSPKLANSIMQLIRTYLASTSADKMLMEKIRKEISFETFNSYFLE